MYFLPALTTSHMMAECGLRNFKNSSKLTKPKAFSSLQSLNGLGYLVVAMKNTRTQSYFDLRYFSYSLCSTEVKVNDSSYCIMDSILSHFDYPAISLSPDVLHLPWEYLCLYQWTQCLYTKSHIMKYQLIIFDHYFSKYYAIVYIYNRFILELFFLLFQLVVNFLEHELFQHPEQSLQIPLSSYTSYKDSSLNIHSYIFWRCSHLLIMASYSHICNLQCFVFIFLITYQYKSFCHS